MGSSETFALEFQEYFKKHYRLMSQTERDETVGSLVMCMTFVFVDLGRPLQFWHLIPGVGQLYFQSSLLSWDIVVLNGYLVLNSIVPGLVPSPMGEIIDYSPSYVELLVAVGVLGLGMFVITMLLKPALIIEKKYEELNSQTS